MLWVLVTAYALTGGADFGGGVWDLLAGGAESGRRPRTLIDRSIAPVWEANHVWLIVDLVVLWTAFPPAFGAIMSTLFIPLSLAAFGVLLRGAGFALRQTGSSLRWQQVNGTLFAASSVVTPYFMGAAVGAIVTGRVPASGAGDRFGSWTTTTCILLGLLSVAAFAYLAAVYLISDARRRDAGLVDYFRRRAVVSGVIVGALAGAALFELDRSAPRIVHRLLYGAGLPLVVLSAALGLAVLLRLLLNKPDQIRPMAALAFAAVIWGWGIAQWPELLPRTLTVHRGAAPPATLITELLVIAVVAVLVGPAFALLFHLTQRNMLIEEEASVSAVGSEGTSAVDPRAQCSGHDRTRRRKVEPWPEA